MRTAVFAALAECFCLASTSSGQVTSVKTIKDVPNNGKAYSVRESPFRRFTQRRSPFYLTVLNDYPKGSDGEEDYNAKPTDSTTTKMILSAEVLVTKKGDKERSVIISFLRISKYGATESNFAAMSFQDAEAFNVRLHDVLRIGRTWDSEGTPKEDKTIDFNPLSGIHLSVHKYNGAAEFFPVFLGHEGYLTDFRSLSAYSDFVTTYDEYLAWLEKS